MSTYSVGVVALGPLFYYRLDESSGTTAADSSGNGRTGTYTASGVTYGQPTLLSSDPDTSVAFNGSTGSVSVANALITDTFTLEAWIKPAAFGSFASFFGSNNGGSELNVDAGGHIQCTKSGVGMICDSGSTTLTLGNVYHVVWTKSGATNHLYINAVDVTANLVNATCTSPVTTYIGNDGGGGAHFNGTVDEAAVYGFALTAGQVMTNYTNGTTVAAGPPPTMPRVIVEVAFANNPLTPLGSLVWTDITRYCQLITTTSGREVETGQVAPGTLSVRLWNADARFNPFNTTSPYAGPFTDGTDTGVLGLVPGKRIRVRATWGGTTYNVWHGFIDAWPMNWPSEMTAYVDVTATDGFKLLNLRQLSTVYGDTITADKPLAWYRLGDITPAVLATPRIPVRTTGPVAPFPVALPPTGGVTFGGPPLLSLDPNTSATFNGVIDSAISFGRYALQTAGSSYTAEMWIQTGQTSGIIGLICQGAGGRDRWGVTFNTATSALTMTVSNGATTETVTVTATSLNNNKPHYIAAVRDVANSLNTIAFDSTSSSAATSLVAGTLDSDLWVGGAGSGAIGASIFFAGSIQDFAIYNTAITSRLTTHFNAGNAALGNELSGARINRMLDLVGWPSADRAIDPGLSLLQGSRQGNTALAEILLTVASEGAGLCFMSPDGKVTFYDRQHTLTNAASLSSQVTLGEAGEPYELANTNVALDDLEVFNDIQVTRQNGVTIYAEDLVSRARYGQRTLTVSGLTVSADAQAGDLASYWLSRYTAPRTRVKAVNVHPVADANTLFPQVLGRTLLDQITVTRTPPGGGSAFSQPSAIERIAHTIDPIGDWHTTWGLSAADTTRYWVLQHATYGVLNSTTRLYF